MAKLVAGVKSFKAVTVIAVPVNTVNYRTSNGRTYGDAASANRAQSRLNFTKKSQRISTILSLSGYTPANNPHSITTHQLAVALNDPSILQRLLKAATAR